MSPTRLQSVWRMHGVMSHAVPSKLWRWRGYRDGALSRDQVGQLLGFSLWETEAFLKQRQAYLQYTEADLANDRSDLGRATT
jgi:hypothetical protein